MPVRISPKTVKKEFLEKLASSDIKDVEDIIVNMAYEPDWVERQ